MESKKIIEVFVETDEEESYSSSSDDDRAKVATKVSKSKDGSTKEAVHSRCVDIGGNNVPEQTVPQLQGREETTEPERMDLESAKVVNSNTGVTKLGAKKETVVIRHLGDSDGSTSSSDSESSEGSADSPTETGQPQNSAIEVADHDGAPKPSSTNLFNTPHDNKIYCVCRQPALNQFMIQCDKCQDWFHGSCVGITLQRAANIKEFYCPPCSSRDPSLSTLFKTSEGEEPKPKHVTKKVAPPTPAAKKCAKKHSRRCGECVACLTVTDCTKCRFCKDMRKYGGPGRMRQKCIKRQCLRFSRILYAEDPLNKKKGGSHPTPFQQDVIAELKALGADLDDSGASPDAKRIRNEGTGEEDGSRQKHGSRVKVGKRPSKKSAQSKGGRPAKKAVVTSSGSEAEVAGQQVGSDDPFSAPSPYEERYPAQRCEGPGCVFMAQPGSRYCSEECGVNLAKIRITTLLPKQKELWEQGGDQEAMATKMNKQKLQELEDTQKSIKKRLEELDQQTLAIDAHIMLASKATPLADEECLDGGSKNEELMIYCATCGQPQPLRAALNHFEKCYSKAEGMVSFGSIVRNEGTSIFCEKYDPVQQSYCKRLRVLCPEHTKEPKISPNEVCGCPLDPNFPCIVLDPLEVKFCRQPKRSCTRHYCWERLRRAEIDQEKLNLYLKLEDVSEQIRINQWQIENRGSLLPTMLHHTVDHTKGTSQSSPWRQ